ncbi:MAG: N-acetylmuramoyl-L-alanine amidase [Pseudomonadota bacterium]
MADDLSQRIKNCSSPNHGPRKGGVTSPDLIVLHYTALSCAEDALAMLCDADREVSAHYVIARDGQITRLVEETQRAWHAGAGCWAGCDDINSRSIGIELDNDGTSPFSAPLMDALETLLADIMPRWSIAPQNVIAHSDLAPTRKIDPGPRFDWRRLALGGFAIWPDDSDAPDAPLASSLAALGYDVEGFGLAACQSAFSARFGAKEGAQAAANLAARFGIDRHPTLA